MWGEQDGGGLGGCIAHHSLLHLLLFYDKKPIPAQSDNCSNGLFRNVNAVYIFQYIPNDLILQLPVIFKAAGFVSHSMVTPKVLA